MSELTQETHTMTGNRKQPRHGEGLCILACKNFQDETVSRVQTGNGTRWSRRQLLACRWWHRNSIGDWCGRRSSPQTSSGGHAWGHRHRRSGSGVFVVAGEWNSAHSTANRHVHRCRAQRDRMPFSFESSCRRWRASWSRRKGQKLCECMTSESMMDSSMAKHGRFRTRVPDESQKRKRTLQCGHSTNEQSADFEETVLLLSKPWSTLENTSYTINYYDTRKPTNFCIFATSF